MEEDNSNANYIFKASGITWFYKLDRSEKGSIKGPTELLKLSRLQKERGPW